MTRRANVGRLVAIAIAVAALAVAGWVLHDGGYLSRGFLTGVAERSGPWAPVLIVAAMILAVVIGPIPTVPVSVASGVLFGPGPGFVYAAGGALAGALAAFGLARALGRPLAARFARGHIAVCPQCSDRLLFWVVLASRLVPVVSFALVSYGAGLTAMTARAFALATLIGMTPMTAIYVALGAAVTVDPLWAGLGGLVAVALALALPRLVERHDPFGVSRLLRHD
mgnify:CR=1 FL=1